MLFMDLKHLSKFLITDHPYPMTYDMGIMQRVDMSPAKADETTSDNACYELHEWCDHNRI